MKCSALVLLASWSAACVGTVPENLRDATPGGPDAKSATRDAGSRSPDARTATADAMPKSPDASPSPPTVQQLCVDTINNYRATLGLPPYARWMDAETCAEGEAQMDSMTGMPHSAFGRCGEWAQNECPGWSGPPIDAIPYCLAQMWAEGPGDDFASHGHYINMSSTRYSRVACGFYSLPSGSFWGVQDFQ